MRRWRLSVLRLFGRFQRPIAWGIMLTGVGSFFAVLFNLVATGNAKAASLLAAIILWSDGFQAVQEVENQLDSEGAVDE